ncbi:MAG: GLPGLI family protein [Bacteroidetes bacterium]|nr:GLPGLI family protein [Bacteroidota bacterium]MCL2303151.1 GLPGLI family protein [Lentimicrobiaceae bacterium]
MKKTILLTLSLFLIVNWSYSQESGVVNYTVSHNWVKKIESSKTLPKATREQWTYVYSGMKEYEQKATLKFNPDAYRFEYKESEDNQWRKGDEYIIYRDRENGNTFDVMTLLNKQYIIQDSINCQHWKIKNDMKEIAGHICMNASYYDPIKDKEVIAWFALDLPVPIGPDRYCGLPGMILEINEANGAVVYTATSVLLSNEKMEIEKPAVKKKRKAITQKEYDKRVMDYINQCEKMQRPYFWGIAF